MNPENLYFHLTAFTSPPPRRNNLDFSFSLLQHCHPLFTNCETAEASDEMRGLVWSTVPHWPILPKKHPQTVYHLHQDDCQVLSMWAPQSPWQWWWRSAQCWKSHVEHNEKKSVMSNVENGLKSFTRLISCSCWPINDKSAKVLFVQQSQTQSHLTKNPAVDQSTSHCSPTQSHIWIKGDW